MLRTAIVWYRRDLRVHDHPALSAACREYERVVPLFVLDRELIHGHYQSPVRVDFMLGCLRALDTELCSRGSRLVVREGRPERVLVELARELGAEAVLWTSDVSPYARARDLRVSDALASAGVQARPHGGGYVTDVSRLRTAAGDPYRVFSPFLRSWKEAERRPVLKAPDCLPPLPARLAAGRIPVAAEAIGLRGERLRPEPVLQAGERPARAALRRWLDDGLERYAERQDRIAPDGTSQLSPYLRFGCLSVRELEQRAERQGGPGAGAWIRQLGWRDFYAHVLLHWPENVRREFQPRRRGMEWEHDHERLQLWQKGLTGYPIVDAGMRQLASTGWMHNRARLIVGSFLTKDLHLDWREGERWFARLLLDGEPAQNNGNWQWIASVGTDPAPPYRRLYNPTLQGRRFDPDGEYVRRWVPELAEVPLARLFEPWAMSEGEQRRVGCRIGCDYPDPVVEHGRERLRALERYAMASTRSGG